MKPLKLIPTLLVLTFFTSCSAKRLTVEDVNKKIELARKSNSEALVKSKEAINARNQFTNDYKATEIEKIDKRIKSIDKQIKSIKRSAKSDENEAASSSLNNAVVALENEKKTLNAKKQEINNIQSKNWEDNITEVDSAMNIINTNINEVESSLEKLNKK